MIHLIIAMLLAAAPASSSQWPGWRNDGNGHYTGNDAPLHWDGEVGVAWKARLPGEGFSSPIVYDGRVYLTAAIEGGMRRAMLCLDEQTGSILWQTPVESEQTKTYPRCGHAAPTPVTDGKRVFAYFDVPGLVAFDVNGKVLWQWQPPVGPINSTYNQASSPILVDNMVILNVTHRGPSFLFALDQATGEVLWQTEKGKGYCYATPLHAQFGDEEQIILNGTSVVSYAKTGEALWTVTGMKPAVNPSVVVANDLVYATSGRNGPSMIIDPTGRDDVTNSHVLMLAPSGGPYVPSPVVYKDLYIVPGDDGRIRVYRKDGSTVARYRIRARTTGSPIIAGDRLYWFDERAQTWVLDLSHLHDDEPRIEELACNVLPEEEPCLASPAIANGRIYLRTLKHLYAISGGEVKLTSQPKRALPDDYEALKAFYLAQPSKEYDDTMLRLDIVEKLADMDDPRVLEMLMIIIEKDGHWDVSEAAARQMGRFGDAATPHLIAIVGRRTQPFFKTVAAEHLQHIAPAEAMETLITVAQNPKERPTVRSAVIIAIGEVGAAHAEKADAANEVLLALLSDKQGMVRHAAATALGATAKQVDEKREAIIAALKTASTDEHALTAAAARRSLHRGYDITE